MEVGMSRSERFEILILGSGAGGKLLAWHLARAGRRTAVVERRWIGGSCPNIACLPSKNEIWSAKVAHLAHHAAEFGTTALVGANDDRILGFTMMGPEAGEVLAAVQIAMLADLPYSRLRDAVLAHPTMAEGLGALFANVPPRSARKVTPKSAA
jgi:pyruvate/2-oxoglutarate dehydrogenase complex dihydrolipoamide dehydrogenase (E3) component